LTAKNQAAVDGHDAVGEQLEPTAQQDELLAHLADRIAVVAAEVGNRLEVGRQACGQPDQLQVALRLGLQPSAGLHAIEVAVDVYLEQRCWVVGRSTRRSRVGSIEAQLPQIEFVHEYVNDSNRAVLMDPVVQLLWEQSALRSSLPFDVSPHQLLPSI